MWVSQKPSEIVNNSNRFVILVQLAMYTFNLKKINPFIKSVINLNANILVIFYSKEKKNGILFGHWELWETILEKVSCRTADGLSFIIKARSIERKNFLNIPTGTTISLQERLLTCHYFIHSTSWHFTCIFSRKRANISIKSIISEPGTVCASNMRD
jgi:hypothetical protein